MTKKMLIAALAATGTIPAALHAHHSYAMFDHGKEIELTGTVREWQWTSPHTWLYLVVPNGKGSPTRYSIEGGNPGLLRRQGFSKGSMQPGDKVTVYMAPLKSGDKGGALDAVKLANGATLGERNRILGQ